MGSSLFRSRRRVLAFVQLMLFALSASTSLLPCAHATISHATMSHAAISHGAGSHTTTTANVQAHDDAMTGMDMSDASPSISHAPTKRAPVDHAPTHETSCPWVVSCAGVAQFSLDAAWRLAEHAASTVAPIGVTLRYVTTDRDIDAPPPRA